MFKILVVEDDKNIRKLIAGYLKNENYSVVEAADGEEAMEKFLGEFFDMVVTDIMMPYMSGTELCAKIRKNNKDIPILMLTAKGALEDKKEGFKSGADDYMVKPIDMDEMVLRVRALMRRSKNALDKIIKVNNVVINYENLTVTSGDKVIEMPKKEFQLMFKLVSTPDRIFTRMQLMDEIWGYDSESDDRTVDVHIKRIREKLADIDDFEIVTIRGLGYKGAIRRKN
ncbi:MAG: response regulator transcription factor [Clostridiales bacterium]|jgi:DNA-binding response OmpR family regulator|nr:response regulator transcription factor [Clostridiales bacterium]